MNESDDMKPDQVTYGMFLRSCALMEKNEKRDKVIENVFKQCCEDGLLGEFALKEFLKAGSKNLRRLIQGVGGGSRIPRAWKKNVQN